MMNKLTKIFYILAGIFFPILIGLFHNYVHFKDLTVPSVQSYLQEPIDMMGVSSPLWNSWGMMSLMMGTSFIVIGLLNINILKDAIKHNAFSLISIIAMVIYYLSVIYVGHMFDTKPQFFGGFFGLAMILLSYFISRKNKDVSLRT